MKLLYIVNCAGGKKVTPDHEKILAATPACMMHLPVCTYHLRFNRRLSFWVQVLTLFVKRRLQTSPLLMDLTPLATH
jgi:hypothetical protein